MPDISMCINMECESAKSCARFLAMPSFHQSYSGYGAIIGEIKCNSYIDAKEVFYKIRSYEEAVKDIKCEAMERSNV